MKDATGKVVVDENGIKDTWKKYVENLMKEGTESHHEVSSNVTERPANCIVI